MFIISGAVYRKGEFIEGHLVHEDGKIRFHDGLAEDADHHGIIIPAFNNCHMHIGDSAIPKPPPGTVEEIVGPPNGYKHRMLGQLSDDDITMAVSDCMEGMIRGGIGRFIDFREGGLAGIQQLNKAIEGKRLDCDIYSRPIINKYNENELDELLGTSTGIGISAISDWDRDELEQVAEHLAGSGKPLGIHASEMVREDVGAILDLGPKFLVHMIRATDDDLLACRAENIPVILCPRANSFFGLQPPIDRMLDAGLDICLGTDNVMLAEPDMFKEMRALRELASPDKLTNKGLLGIVFDNSRKVLNSNPSIGVGPWGYDGFLVLDRPLDDPSRQVMDAIPDDICFQWRP